VIPACRKASLKKTTARENTNESSTLKVVTDCAAYLFDDLLVSPGSQSGTYTLAFVNGGGAAAGLPSLADKQTRVA
jgi:hypothetical protein